MRCQGLPGRRGCPHSEDVDRCGVSEAKWGKEEVQRGRQGGSHGNLVTYSGIDQISNYIKEKNNTNMERKKLECNQCWTGMSGIAMKL